jgi:hypothetical protein
MLLTEPNYDLASAISGTIFTDDKFILKINVLAENALDGLADKPILVVGDHQYADFH